MSTPEVFLYKDGSHNINFNKKQFGTIELTNGVFTAPKEYYLIITHNNHVLLYVMTHI